MKILFICDKPPASTRMPGSPRQYNLCKELSKNNEIHLLCFKHDKEREKELEEFKEAKTIFKKIHFFKSEASKASWIEKQQHRLTLQASFSMRFKNPKEMLARKEFVEKVAKDNKSDLLLIDGVQNWQFISADLNHIPRAIDFCDCITGLLVQQAKAASSIKEKIRMYLEAFGVMQAEKKALKECDLGIAISSKDETTLRTIHKTADTVIVPNGVDTEFFKRSKPKEKKKKIIFTGVMGYEPNEDAVLFFAKDIFPIIQKKHQDSEFWIVGARPPESVEALKEKNNIYVTGSVDDIRPYLEEACVFACPLRLGAGVKNKILSAWSMELPVVATSLSMSGLDAEDRSQYILADKPGDFADAICEVFEKKDFAVDLGKKGRKLAVGNFSWQSANLILEESLVQLAKNKTNT